MSLVSGVNHVAIVTSDLDRFVDFYSRVLGLELVFSEDAPAFRHAILRSGAQSWLHPVQLPGNAHGVAASTMFERGHLDHIALTAASPQSFEELRRRLVSCGACDGGVEDLGAFHALWFCDPDGMRVELALIVDPELRGFHAPVRRRDTGGEAGLSIERLTGDDARTLVEPLFREYVPWVFGKLASECGVRFDDPESVFERHHSALAAEMSKLLGDRGRLLLARLDGEPAGVGALKPVERGIAEIKRLYVRPSARGRGVGRAVLLHLIADARAEGYRSARLETLSFMFEAQALYRSLGFVDTGAFEQSESDMAGLTSLTRYMELPLQPAG